MAAFLDSKACVSAIVWEGKHNSVHFAKTVFFILKVVLGIAYSFKCKY